MSILEKMGIFGWKEEEDEETLSSEIPYTKAIDLIMYSLSDNHGTTLAASCY